MQLNPNLISKPSLLDNKHLIQNAQQFLVYTGEKKQAVNFIEQMTLCYISRGKNAEWMF